MKQLGLEHHILSLDWGKESGPPTKGKVQVAARDKRYSALLGLCERLDIRDLMVAHHMDDQIGRLTGSVNLEVCWSEGVELVNLVLIIYVHSFFVMSTCI